MYAFGFTTTLLLVTSFLCGEVSAGYLFRLDERGTTVVACIGKNLSLTCHGSNGSTFKWSHNGLKLNAPDHVLIEAKNCSQLRIQEYKPENAGLYSCKEFDQHAMKISETKLRVVTERAPNASIQITHHQYYEDHLVFIQFKSLSAANSSNLSYAVDYKCMSPYDIFPLCVTHWQPIPLCDEIAKMEATFYSCVITHNRVLLGFQYELRATVKTACGSSQKTTRFSVGIPSFSEPLKDLNAVAVNHRTVKLSWRTIDLLRDVENFRTENTDMVMKVTIQLYNASTYKSIVLKPSVNSTLIRGFLPLRNYTLAVSYHLVVSGLALQPSKTSHPVSVQMPDILRRSESAVNVSCFPLFNETPNVYMVSWRILKTSHNIGSILQVMVIVTFAKTQLRFEVNQKPATSKSLLFNATTKTDVQISVCNEAGCSDVTNTVCLFAHAQKKGDGGPDYTLVIICVVIASSIPFILYAILRFFKKRKLEREKKNENIEIIYPTVWHQYTEPDNEVSIAELP